MPYVGFHPDVDPGYERALKGGRRMARRVTEVVPEWSLHYRWANPVAEHHATGTILLPSDRRDWDPDNPPERVVRYGATTRIPLVVYYRLPWPTEPQLHPEEKRTHAQDLL